MKSQLRVMGALLALGALSVIVRLGEFGGQLTREQEISTALFLNSLTIFQKFSAGKFLWAPVQTFGNAGDLFVWNSGIRTMSTEGFGFYTSYPPLSLFVGWSVFSLSGTEPSVTGIQFLAVALHLLFAPLVYFLVRWSASDGSLKEVGALTAVALYLFQAPLLWYLGVTFSWDSFWHFPLILFLFAMMGWLRAREDARASAARYWLCLLLAAVFAIAYSDFGSLLFIALFVVVLPRVVGNPREWGRISVLAVGVYLAGTLLALLQYRVAIGPAFEIRSILSRVQERATAGGYVEMLGLMVDEYFALLSPTILLLLVLGALAMKRGRVGDKAGTVAMLLILGGGVLLHHLLLPSWVAYHSFGTVRGGIALAVMLGVLISSIKLDSFPRFAALSVAVCIIVGVTLACCDGILRYQARFVASDAGLDLRAFGQLVNTRTTSEDVIFVNTPTKIWAPEMYAARRNILSVKSTAQACEFLIDHPGRGGVMFTLDAHLRVLDAQRITPAQCRA